MQHRVKAAVQLVHACSAVCIAEGKEPPKLEVLVDCENVDQAQAHTPTVSHMQSKLVCVVPVCAQVDGMIGAFYADFMSAVAKGRGMTKEAVRAVAKGRCRG
jgi:ClpP class serine protease